MIDFKNCSELSNSEIKLYMKTLENEFEVVKVKIREKCEYLENIDKEFTKAEAELRKRQTL